LKLKDQKINKFYILFAKITGKLLFYLYFDIYFTMESDII